MYDKPISPRCQAPIPRGRRSMGYTGIDEKLLGLLISVQFDSYRRVVLGSPDAATADGYMNSLMTYYLGGWGTLFDSANKSEEDVKNEV